MIKILLLLLCCYGIPNRCCSQAQELEELALDIEKLAQFKQILSDLKKGYAILEGGYNTIKNISEGNFSLHKAFLDGLLAISPAVAGYKKILRISESQLQLMREYKSAYKRFQQQGILHASELLYIGKVYDNLLAESLKDLSALLRVLTAGELRMSDDERIQSIDAIDASMNSKLSFLRYFTSNADVLSLQRRKEQADIHSSQLLQGVVK